MQNKPVRIIASSYYYPETILDNKFFEQLDIGTNEEWISDRTGILTRPVCLLKDDIPRLKNREVSLQDLKDLGRVLSPQEMVKRCWPMLQKNYPHFSAEQISTLILATCFPDHDIPANACLVSHFIGAKSATAMDVNTACSGFITALRLSQGLSVVHPQETIALAVCDRPATTGDYADRSNCVLFGDSAALFILECRDDKPGFEIIDSNSFGDPDNWDKVLLPVGKRFSQDGKVVQKFAVRKTVESSLMLLEKNNLKVADLNYFIAHQANFRMLQSVVEKLGIPDSKHLYNVDRCGNQGAAGSASTLAENWHKFKNNDLVMITVVGGGLTWGSVLLRYKGDT